MYKQFIILQALYSKHLIYTVYKLNLNDMTEKWLFGCIKIWRIFQYEENEKSWIFFMRH